MAGNPAGDWRESSPDSGEGPQAAAEGLSAAVSVSQGCPASVHTQRQDEARDTRPALCQEDRWAPCTIQGSGKMQKMQRAQSLERIERRGSSRGASEFKRSDKRRGITFRGAGAGSGYHAWARGVRGAQPSRWSLAGLEPRTRGGPAGGDRAGGAGKRREENLQTRHFSRQRSPLAEATAQGGPGLRVTAVLAGAQTEETRGEGVWVVSAAETRPPQPCR